MADQESTTANGIENAVNVQASKKTTITNIYYVCLERILDFLDVESLVNVADTCKHLQIGAAHYFGEKFGDRFINLKVNNTAPAVDVFNCKVIVRRLKTSLALMRCFGSKIKRLDITSNDYIDYFKQYLMKYCMETLKEIDCYGWLPDFPVDESKDTFKNVEALHICDAVLKDQLAGIVHWFPSLTMLALCCISFDVNFVGVHVPKMVALRIHVDEHEFAEKGLKSLVHANRQLGCFHIMSDTQMTLTALLEIISGNSLITKVDMMVDIESDVIQPIRVNAEELERFAKDHPSIVSLCWSGYQLAANDAIAFISKLGSLNHFHFNVMGRWEYDRLTKHLDKKWNFELKREIKGVHIVEVNSIKS